MKSRDLLIQTLKISIGNYFLHNYQVSFGKSLPEFLANELRDYKYDHMDFLLGRDDKNEQKS